MIKIEIIGHLGKDAEIREYNGNKFITFSVAHSERYTDQQGNQQEKTTWVDCTRAYSPVAEYLKKGTKVFVRGNASARAYTTQSGQIGASLGCRVQELELLTPRQEQSQPQPQQIVYMNNPAKPTVEQANQLFAQPTYSIPGDDLPF